MYKFQCSTQLEDEVSDEFEGYLMQRAMLVKELHQPSHLKGV